MTTYAEVFAGVYTAVAAHAQHQDAGDTDGIMALYTPDAVLEVPGMGVYDGAEAIRAAWDDWKPKGLQRHMPVNVVITDWDDEEARATTDVVFIAQGEGGWSVQIVARYYDVFRQAGGKWLFSRRADEYIGCSSASTRAVSCASARTTRSASRRGPIRTPAGTPARESTVTRGCWPAARCGSGPTASASPRPTSTANGRLLRSRPGLRTTQSRSGQSRIVTEIRDAAGSVVASDRSQVSLLPGEPATVRQRLYVRGPALWGPESPALYGVRVTLTDEHGEIDAETVIFGIRSLRLDPERGLRINGETVKLRGACVHHDNGVLGAATFPRAEERRVQILKDAGFNAIRMSHHPMSKAMLDACDRLGVLVMDEAFDLWTSAKSDFDYSLNFPQWWERDIEAMVAKDVNHPSVVLYSIGNEIPETGSPAGAAWGRKLAEKVRALDSTRYVTNAVNGMVAVIGDLAAIQLAGARGRRGQRRHGRRE